jgi:signal transduction histidine kinase
MRVQLGHIRDSARRLTNMVDDLIVEAMNDALDISIRREPVDFAALAAEVVGGNRPLAESKQQRITLSGQPSLTLNADQERLREAIDNLVGNAIKYSPIGEEIDVAVAVKDGEAVCSVRDHGPGLSPEDMGRLFGRFQRLSAKPTAGEGSTGLGLSIVKRIAELHGGRVTADSAGPGSGATFSLHLPTQQAQAQ